jgi:hypothetical protein
MDDFEDQLADLIRVSTGVSKAKAARSASQIIDILHLHEETVAGAATWGSSVLGQNRPNAVRFVTDWR